MRTTSTFPLPTCVMAVDDGSRRRRTTTTIAEGIARRLNVPTHRLTLDDGHHRAETVMSAASQEAALVVATVGSTQRHGSLGRVLAASAKLPWVAIGPGLRSARRSGPEILTIPIDGTPRVDALVPTALAWAAAFDLAVHLIAVLQDGSTVQRGRTPVPEQAFSTDPDAYLQRLRDRHASDAVTLKTDVLRDPIGVASAMERYLRETPDDTVDDAFLDGPGASERCWTAPRPLRSSDRAQCRCS